MTRQTRFTVPTKRNTDISKNFILLLFDHVIVFIGPIVALLRM